MLAGAAAGALLGDDGIDPAFQDNGPAFFGAALEATAAEQGFVPGKTNLTVQPGLPHLGFLKIHFLQSFGGADTAAFHTEHTRGLSGKDLRSAGAAKEQVETGAQDNAVEGADLGALAAVQAARQELLFRRAPGGLRNLNLSIRQLIFNADIGGVHRQDAVDFLEPLDRLLQLPGPGLPPPPPDTGPDGCRRWSFPASPRSSLRSR